MSKAPNTLRLLLALVLGLGSAMTSARMYRWVDDAGDVHYTDKIPPEYADQGRAEIDSRGLHVGEVAPAPTQEEIERQQALERERAAEEKRLARQSESDKVLLRTYRTLDDIVLARNGRIASADARIRVLFNRIDRLNAQIEQLQPPGESTGENGKQNADPAGRTRAGELAQQIEGIYVDILREKLSRQATIDQSDAQLQRYRELKKLPPGAQPAIAAQDDDNRLLLDTFVTCDTEADCNARWQRARAFFEEQATLAVLWDTQWLLMTTLPKKEPDTGLAVVRIPAAGERPASVFLDLRCLAMPAGNIPCGETASRDIRDAFIARVNGEDAPSAAQK